MAEETMRLTIIDAATVVSLVTRATAAHALTAACAIDPQTLGEVLTAVQQFDRTLPTQIKHGLAIFDEHNTPTDHAAIDQALAATPAHELPVLRVIDERTRNASLAAVGAGIVVFNLPKRRIIQIVNTYEPLLRSGAVNYHNGRFLSRRQFTYALNPVWSIVP